MCIHRRLWKAGLVSAVSSLFVLSPATCLPGCMLAGVELAQTQATLGILVSQLLHRMATLYLLPYICHSGPEAVSCPLGSNPIFIMLCVAPVLEFYIQVSACHNGSMRACSEPVPWSHGHHITLLPTSQSFRSMTSTSPAPLHPLAQPTPLLTLAPPPSRTSHLRLWPPAL